MYRPGGANLSLANRTVALGKFSVYDMIVVEFSDLLSSDLSTEALAKVEASAKEDH